MPAILFLLCACHNPKKQVNVSADEVRIYIPTGAHLRQVLDSAAKVVDDIRSLEAAAKKMDYKIVYPGRYTFTKGATNEDIIKKLQAGLQDEIILTVGNYSSIYELAEKMEPFIRIGKEEIIEAMGKQPEVEGMDTLKWIYCLAPNTYNFFWNVSGEEFVRKLIDQYKKFWTEDRKALLAACGLTEMQVVTLASIVQLESYKVDEQPKVAGLYLNRLKKGMKLQADPTVVFLIKKEKGWGQKISRVYYKDLAINSPYNTYRYAGLPPGPICMPNPSAIDAVLKPEKSDYIYFAADPERPGYHNFARTAQEHEVNARKYREWANKNNVK